MSIGGLSEILGMGVTVQLRNMFTGPARQVEMASRGLSNSIIGDQRRLSTSMTTMAGGGSLMLFGAGIISMFVGIGKASLKASSDLEIFRNQIQILARSESVGNDLYQKLLQFSVHTPFTIPQVMAGAKNLMAFGFGANRVMEQMRLAGEWASMMQMPIDYAAMILGKVRTGGIAQAMRFIQVRGISYKDVQDEGGPIDPKTQRTMRGADPEKFLEALNRVIQKRFSGKMEMYMQTLPGMWSNMVDQMIILGAGIGDRVKPQMKDIMRAILSVFNPALTKPFTEAFGDGLNLILKMLAFVLAPLAKFVVWIMQLSKEHPNYVKFGTASLFVAGGLTVLAGAALLAAGAIKMMGWVIGFEKLAAARAAVMGMLGPLGWLMLGVIAFGIAWNKNFLGIRTVISPVIEHLWMIGSAIVELFTNINSGVGVMSMQTADKLGKAGLMGITVTLFMNLYRLYQVFMGIWDALKTGAKILAFFGSVMFWVLSPIWGTVYVLIRLGQVLGIVANTADASTWKAFGYTIGFIGSMLGIAHVAMKLWAIWTFVSNLWTSGYNISLGILWVRLMALTVAQKAATAAQWLLNIALNANPIGIIIFAIGVLITIVVACIVYAKQLTQWFESLGPVGKFLVHVFLPFIELTAKIYRNWGQIKSFFSDFGSWMKNLWDGITGWIATKVAWMVEKMARVLRHLPGEAGQVFTQIDDARKAREAAVNKAKAIVEQQQRIQLMFDARNRDAEETRRLGRYIEVGFDEMGRHLLVNQNKPIQNNITLKLDGKTIAKQVTVWQASERESGRD